MSSTLQQQIAALLASVNEMDRTPEAVAAAEEAVRLADSLGDQALAYEARQALIEQAAFTGNPDKLLVAFSWCLSHADNDPKWDPDGWEAMSLLWRYKWVVENTVDFPGISREKIFAMIDDFRARCLASGYSERSALDLRFSAERRMGNLAAAQEWFDRWQVASPDSMDDCKACEVQGVISFLVDSGRYSEAIDQAAPLLSGRMQCAEIPQKTFGTLLEAYWRTGQTKEAAESHTKGYRLVRNNRAFVVEQGAHLLHLVRAGQPEKALTLLRRHLPWALEAASLEDRFRFLLAASTLLQSLQTQGVNSIRIRLEPAICPVSGKATANVNVLRDWVGTHLQEIAGQFDRRNGNQWYSSRIERLALPGTREAA